MDEKAEKSVGKSGNFCQRRKRMVKRGEVPGFEVPGLRFRVRCPCSPLLKQKKKNTFAGITNKAFDLLCVGFPMEIYKRNATLEGKTIL